MTDYYSKILFVLRIDASIKGGGDLVQAKHYQKILEEELTCKVYFAHDLTKSELKNVEWDVVQLFNISRLHENMTTIAELRYKRILLTPILQPGFIFDFKALIKTIIRGLLWRTFSLTLARQSTNTILQQFDGFVFLSDSEKKAFFLQFPILNKKENTIFHNGVAEGLTIGAQPRIFDFIIVGRVEPKKRVIEAIDTVSTVTPKPLLLCVGGVNWYHPIYCAKFFLRVLRGNVVYLGKKESAAVFQFMRMTKTLLNFSELEVSPLVDLEALACGCNVISTIYSFPHQPISNHYERIDVKIEELCVRAIRHSLTDRPLSELKINTWKENSSAYIKMIGEQTTNSELMQESK
ncbi:Glycosyl transferases group 1 [compost metagenome]